MAGFIVPFSVSAYLLLDVTTSLASRLTAWEAAYRGLRLPRPVVERALQYHSAHYLPVALFTFITIAGYQYLIQYRPSIAFEYAFWNERPAEALVRIGEPLPISPAPAKSFL